MSDKLNTPITPTIKNYLNALLAQKIISQHLLNNLNIVTLQPKNILILGADFGLSLSLLQEKYPHANITILDPNDNFLTITKEIITQDNTKTNTNATQQNHSAITFLSEEPGKTTLKDNSIDLIFSNCFFHKYSLNKIYKEALRILKKDALFIFATFGLDTLYELNQCITQILPNNKPLFNTVDLHNIGDDLAKFGFDLPVTSMDKVTISYQDLDDVFYDLILLDNIGLITTQDNLNHLLANKEKLNVLYQAYQDSLGNFKVTYEVIFAITWLSEKTAAIPTKIFY